MMQAGVDDAAAFDIGFAGSATALDRWPTGLFRADVAPVWTTDGPAIPGSQPPRTKKALANGGVVIANATKAGVALLELDVGADVVTITAPATARGRLRDASGNDRQLAEISAKPLCTVAGGCVCPDGTAAAGAAFAALAPGEAWLGVTGGTKPAAVTVAGRSLGSFCAKPASVDPCIVGTWIGEGVTLQLPEIAIVGSGGRGAVLRFEKDGTGSVDMDPSAPVEATLPGGLAGAIRLTGRASGVVSASKGVMRTITTTASGFQLSIDVPPLGGQVVPLSGTTGGAPFDGQYSCTKTTLVYTAPGFGGQSTWTRSG